MEKRILIDGPTLAERLKSAASAHHEYEKNLGKPDADWPAWYARFVIDSMPFNSSIQPARVGTANEARN